MEGTISRFLSSLKAWFGKLVFFHFYSACRGRAVREHLVPYETRIAMGGKVGSNIDSYLYVT